MRVFGGIEMRNGECSLVLLDESNREVLREKFKSGISEILECVSAFSNRLAGVVVKPCSNPDWLVNGLTAAGFSVYLADFSIPDRGDRVKYGKSVTDAALLAHMLLAMAKTNNRPKHKSRNKPTVKTGTAG